MKIAINAIPYTSFQGIESFMLGLLRAWPETSDEIIVFANKKSAEFLTNLSPFIKIVTVEVKLNRFHLFAFLQFQLPALLRNTQIDILFCPSLETPWFYNDKITAIHDAAPFVLKNESGFMGRIFWKINLFFAKRSKHIITVSEFSKQELTTHLQIPPERISIIYNGCSESLVAPLNKEKYLLYIGNARPRKNLERLIEGFTLARAQILNIRLLIVGKEDARMLDLKEKYIHEGVEFLGFVTNDKKKSLLAHATALVFPSLYEGFGIPILEAQSEGTAVLCSDIPAFREIGADSVSYFDPNSAGDINRKIFEISNNPSIRISHEEKGIYNCRRFSWQRSSEILNKLLLKYAYPANK